MYAKFIKRPLDLSLSLLGLIVLLPLLMTLVVLVRLKLGPQVIFKQKRPGKICRKTGKEKIFTIYKFRTMINSSDESGESLPDEMRLTGFGKMLRSTSLDELPELWNIIRGDMSIVGPRPLLVQYLPLYNEYQRRRHEVRPGFTGYAQVQGRNNITWEEKFGLDVKYVDHITFLGDIKIILQTVKKVLIREGINSATSVTMETFQGTAKSINTPFVN